MKSGWLKIYRSIVDWEWFSEHDMTVFFIWCLCNANVDGRMWRGVYVKPGQLVVSRSTVCKELGISERRYRTIISRFAKSGEITMKPQGAFSILTIVNWEIYQEDTISENVFNNEKTTSPKADECVEKTEVREEPFNSLFTQEEVLVSEKPTPKVPELDCSFVVKLFNDRCKGFPKIVKLTEKRKKVIRIWFDDIGGTYDKVQEIFDRAQSSSFLRGDNNRAWSADFDWIIHKSNWVKILEGKYDDKKNVTQNNYETQQSDRYAKRRGADSSARSAEDYTDTI